MQILHSTDFAIEGGNLGGEQIDLIHHLPHAQIQIAALCLQLVDSGSKTGCQVAAGGHNPLARRRAGRIGGKLFQAAEKLLICVPEISAATVEHHFNLLQCGHHGVQPAVLLGFLVQAKFENGVAQTLYAVQHHAAAKGREFSGTASPSRNTGRWREKPGVLALATLLAVMSSAPCSASRPLMAIDIVPNKLDIAQSLSTEGGG